MNFDFLTVKQLKEILENCADDDIILICGEEGMTNAYHAFYNEEYGGVYITDNN